jgi:hypothetical protein
MREKTFGLLDALVVLCGSAALTVFIFWLGSVIAGRPILENLPEWLNQASTKIWGLLTSAGVGGGALALRKRLDQTSPSPNYLKYMGGTTALLIFTVWGVTRMLPSPGPEPSSFDLKLQVLLDKQFGAVDSPPPMVLGPVQPRERDKSLLQPGSLGKDGYEYESKYIDMPLSGHPYLGYLHRQIFGAEKTENNKFATACFVAKARSRGVENIVRLSCKEGGTCQVASDDPGWATDCPPRQASTQWPSLIPVVFAQSPVVLPSEDWVVPSIETLSNQEAEKRNPAFTEFLITSGPMPSLSKATRVANAIRVNGTPVYIDGLPPGTSSMKFAAATGLNVRFGLENLDFSGEGEGFEDIEVTLEFRSERELIRKAVVHLRYIALRPIPLNPASTSDTDLGIQWRALYHPGRTDDVYQIFLLSSRSRMAVVNAKKTIDAAHLRLGSDDVVAVVRPPMEKNESYGVALGIRQHSGQVKFTFDDRKSMQLCKALVQMPSGSPLAHDNPFRRKVQNVNFSESCGQF